jgi:hypothetical protein
MKIIQVQKWSGSFDPTLDPNAGHYRIHPLSSINAQRGHHMGVGVHRDADLAVPKRFHYHSRMNALHEQQRSTGVAQVVTRRLVSRLHKMQTVATF